MKRVALALIGLVAVTGCSQSEIRHEVRTIDGVDALCTWRVNPLGAPREAICIPIDGDTP